MNKLNKLREEPCSILLGKGTLDDKAYITANAFIPNMRMNKWKPLNGVPDSNHNFCYIDMDKDSLFEGNECKMNMLSNNPIIDSVWIDSNMENTRSLAFNKCIFSIVPSNATDSNLNKFWKDIDKMNCAAFYSDAQKSNAILTSNIARVDFLIEEQNKLTQYYYKKIARCNVEIDQLNTQYNNIQKLNTQLDYDNNRLRTEIITTSNAINQVNKNTRDYFKKYIAEESNIKYIIAEETLNFTISNALYLRYNESNLRLVRSNEILIQRIFEEDIALSNISSQLTTLRSNNSNVVEDIKLTTTLYITCTQNVRDMDAYILSCRNSIIAFTKSNDKLTIDCNVLITQSNTCSSNLFSCTECNIKLLKELNVLKTDCSTCSFNLSNCSENESNLVIQSNILHSNIVDWLAIHKHCGDIEEENKMVLTNIDLTLKTCRYNELNSYEQRKYDAKRLEAESKASYLHACYDDKNTLFTSLPLPPPLPSVPTVESEDCIGEFTSNWSCDSSNSYINKYLITQRKKYNGKACVLYDTLGSEISINQNTYEPQIVQDKSGVHCMTVSLFGNGHMDGSKDWMTTVKAPGDYTKWALGLPNDGTSAVNVTNAEVHLYGGAAFNWYKGRIFGALNVTNGMPSHYGDNSIQSIKVRPIPIDYTSNKYPQTFPGTPEPPHLKIPYNPANYKNYSYGGT